MKNIFHWMFVVFIFTIALTGCSSDTNVNTYSSCGFLIPGWQNSLPFSWNQNLPVSFQFHSSVPEEHKNFFHDSAQLWNTGSEAELITIQENINYDDIETTDIENDGINVIYWLDSDNLPKISDQSASHEITDKTLGYTVSVGYKWGVLYTQTYNTDIIIVKDSINTFVNRASEYLNAGDIQIFRENVIRNTISHEFGHVLGLGENPHSSLMYPQANIENNLIRLAVNDSDLENLACIYNLEIIKNDLFI